MKTIQINIFLFFFFFASSAVALTGNGASIDSSFVLETSSGKIYGTLQVPLCKKKMPVVLLISGSGPTDRDGNSSMMKGKNESLKMVAQGLCENGIASLRYDKRGIGKSKAALSNEASIRFDDYVNDAKEWIAFLRKDPRFSSVIVAGHSEGSLIGMIASNGLSDKYISIAGPGEPADEILKTQFEKLPETSKKLIYPMLDTLKRGDTLKKVDASFYALFRPSIQPYMISWFKYDPRIEIKKLIIPVLILQGTNDIQISTEDAKRLSKAAPSAQLVLVEKMNHVLKTVDSSERNVNIATYSQPELPLSPELLKSMTDFILKK
jgi:pimeloyl-ACP methyl ester carboxylesterase